MFAAVTSNVPVSPMLIRRNSPAYVLGGSWDSNLDFFNKLLLYLISQAKSVNGNDLQGGFIRLGFYLKVKSWSKRPHDL